MPNVDGKKFPYTKEGMKDAKKAESAKKMALTKMLSKKKGMKAY